MPKNDLATGRRLPQRWHMRPIALMLGLSLGLAAATPAAALCLTADQAGRDARTAPLFERLAASETEETAQQTASSIWQIWAEAPDAHAQDLLDKGMRSIRWGAFDEAETALGYLIDYCPDYAEGWNQRAFARFLNRDYSGALADLDRALALEPWHFGALAGRGLTFLAQGREIQGHDALRKALAVHPWMTERHLLPPEEKT